MQAKRPVVILSVENPIKCDECGCYHMGVLSPQGYHIEDIYDENEVKTIFKSLSYNSRLYQHGRLN